MSPFQPIHRFRDPLILLALTLLAWWPLSLNLLSLKNDALVQYIAYRYHLSEAVQHGIFPFWSPYLYTGFPIHADMQGEVWNPFVLILSLVTRYNMSVFQWEVLIYLYLAGLGLYRLAGCLGAQPLTRIVLGAAFVCCGYMTDSVSVVPWIPSAAFVPWVLLYFLKLLQAPSLPASLKLSVAVSLHFLCGYPSFFIFLSYLLAVGLAAWMMRQARRGQKSSILPALGFLVLAYVVFLLLCSPALVSYYEFLPYYSRGSGLGWEKGQTNPFPPAHAWSWFLANAYSKVDSWNTDISMRNGYFGLFLFLFLAGSRPWKGFRLLVLVLTAFCFLFSLGAYTPVQKFFFDHVPLMNTFRHPGTIRMFTTIGLLLLAAPALDDFFRRRPSPILWAAALTGFLLLALMLWQLPQVRMSALIPPGWSPAALKGWLDALDRRSVFLLIELLQFLFIALFFLIWWRKRGARAFAVLFLLNSLVFGWIGLPFTAVSQARTADVNAYLASFPDGYPLPDPNASAEAEVISDSIEIHPYGYPNFYHKKITIQDEIITPTLNSDYETFLSRFHLRRALADVPFVFLADTSRHPEGILFPAPAAAAGSISVRSFEPNHFVFEVNKRSGGRFFLFQQYHHNWEARVNGRLLPIARSNLAFMSLDLPTGVSEVEFSYRPVAVLTAMAVSGLMILLLVFYFVLRTRKPRRS